MRERLLYVEAKSSGHGGEAWIGFATFSRTGATVFFNGRAFRSLKGSGVSANFFDLLTGESFWISGVKKRGSNRHRFGSGVIQVERRAVPALLGLLGARELDHSRFAIGDAAESSSLRRTIHEHENEGVPTSRRAVDGGIE
jgi:hypothetical protein